MSLGAPPLGVYIHWPYCARVCPYCDFNVVRDRGRRDEQARLVDAIARDLAAQAEAVGPRRLQSVFLGGGTPSLMDPEAAGRLIDLASRLWTPAEDLEVTLEANPTDAEAGRFEAFAAAGVDRLSLGLQALDDESLAFLGRNHDAATGLRAAAAAARAFPRLSLDLIYALPGQTAAGWSATLERAAGLGAEHLSPYQLTIEEGTAFDRAVRRGRLPAADPERGGDLYEATQASLERLGFEAYEVSNHARTPAARSRHNLIYWRGHDYVGVGPGAHGRITGPDGRWATRAEPRIADYLAAVERTGRGWAEHERLDPQEAARERLLMGLRTDEGVAWADLAALALSPEAKPVREMRDLGLVGADSERLFATRAGRLVLDRVIAELAG